MKRWVVRFPHTVAPNGAAVARPDITVVADQCELVDGVAAFYAERSTIPGPAGAHVAQLAYDDNYGLVRAFGVGQWRDVEPLAGPPEPDPEAGVVRGAEAPKSSPAAASWSAGQFKNEEIEDR